MDEKQQAWVDGLLLSHVCDKKKLFFYWSNSVEAGR
jgi:hypothetical protein